MFFENSGFVWFLFLRTVFGNTENVIFVFFEDSSCSLNFSFCSMFFFFSETKKLGIKHVFPIFLCFLRIENSFKIR